MLLQFTVENVLSFKEQAVLSLAAAPGVEHLPGQVVDLPGLPMPVLRAVAVYGPNASGKSNLLKAIFGARELIVKGTRPGAPFGLVPFKLDAATERLPSRVEFELWIDGRRWSYGFESFRAQVHREWLFIDDGDGERQVFTRTIDEGVASFVIGDAAPIAADRRQFWEFVAQGTRPNQLFLAEARERNVGELEPLIAEFVGGFTWIPPNFSLGSLPQLMLRNPPLLTFASSLLRDLGTGVDQLELAVDAPANRQQQWAERLKNMQTSSVDPTSEAVFTEMAAEPSLRVRVRHAAAGHQVALETTAESDGTLRLIQLAPVLFLLTTSRRTLLVDELDRSLHTLLSRQILQKFLESDPQSTGQLIFSTHDTNLLDLTLLPRDSIWFTEKDKEGGSTLYSLAEFEPRQLEQIGDHLEQGYLSGRFGAIPFLADPRRLGWVKTKAS